MQVGQAAVGFVGGRIRNQSYRLEVPAAPTAIALSVVSFKAVESLGKPYQVTVQLTHPLELDRADYLNRPATFVIDPGDGSEPRRFAGWIPAFSKTRQTRDFHGYEMVVEPPVTRLRLTPRSRVYQHKTAPQIIEAILRSHDLEGHQFAFRLRRDYPEHKFRLQYQMSDWDYVRLLMEQEGMYCYFAPGKFGEIAVFGDDIDHYIYQPELRVPYRETAGLESGTEAVFAIRTDTRTVARSILASDYNPAHAYERLKADANIAYKDRTTYGEPYVHGTHHLDMAGAKWEALLRHEAAIAGQVVYQGDSNVLALRPARILRMDTTLPDAPNGQVITEVIHTGARDQAYRNTYQAIPSDRRFRLPVDEAKWPRIAGTLSGRVTSPGQYKYAYLTQDGHYTVRFDLDFDAWPNGQESVPLRLAKPFAGAVQTGFHFPLLEGTEVAIAFHDGNPNRPYIAHALHNSHKPDLIIGRDGWQSRNVIRTQRNNKLRFEDWEGHEGIKLSTEYGGKSQLNLGYLVDRQMKERGQGFELRTSHWGAVRAGKGLFLSADDQPGAGGAQLDMQSATSRLDAALSEMQALARSAREAQAVVAQVEEQRQFLEQRLRQLQQAVLLASAPAGVAITSGEELHLAAQGHVAVNSQGSTDFGVLRRFTVAAGEAISLFSRKIGIKILSGSGKVEIQSQNDEMAVAADKDMTISSANGKVVIAAKKELLLMCGGSYLRLTGSGIEDGTVGERCIRSASLSRKGPASRMTELPDLPGPENGLYSQKLLFRSMEDGAALNGVRYQVFESSSEGMTLLEQSNSETSGASRLEASEASHRTILFGNGEWAVFSDMDFDRDCDSFLDSDGADSTGK
ncbi:type VI secretion system Vgr family protein [Cupriavidus sp. D384]|uniref:type VI secretion system Vgr family protein n=1 Tax=Cupriavidus sp. D384 TaxID=1538095 RepID=UPI001E2C8CF1|nr:type VI secretion system Vgr family protein [Cupriavidus sp. D384]